MKDMKDISASAQEALEHARDKAFGKVKAGVYEIRLDRSTDNEVQLFGLELWTSRKFPQFFISLESKKYLF